ncbi:S1 family peptidase [Vibrio paucivorans]|uniref:Serine protease n=1 Tax=Vibrio paucivorans TaxID=2829489 RepID=A0A9X3CC48_9VIBR|nr:serine protease [Vibrio paucivorans]MCW8332941.1 serine protease [Vibrio paucivorans]
MKALRLGLLAASVVTFASPLSASPEARIIDGTTANQSDWPYMVALVTKGSNAYDGQFCGGSLIDERYVLTAAHCVDSFTINDLDVVVGIHDLTEEGSQGVRLAVDKIYVHENYDSYYLYNDIAVLELERDVASNEATPVTIATSSTRTTTANGTNLTVAGWGTTAPTGNAVVPEQLQQVEVQLVDQQTCLNTYGIGISSNEDSENFCAGVEQEGYDSCRGDSGGPIVVSGTGVQLGIVSWGANECGAQGTYGVYTNISYYAEWIEQHTSGFSYPSKETTAVQSLGSHTYDFVYANNSDSDVDFSGSYISFNGSDFYASISNNECTDAGTLSPGNTCTITVSYSNDTYGSKSYSLYLSYQHNGSTYSTESYLDFEAATAASSALSNAIPWTNTGVYSNEYEWQVSSNGIRSAEIGDSQGTSIYIEGIPAGDVSFDIVVSTEIYADELDVHINGEYIDSVSGDGSVPVTLSLYGASNSLKFTYQKDGSLDYGEDVVYINNMRNGSASTSSSSSSGGGGGSMGWWSMVAIMALIVRRRLSIG